MDLALSTSPGAEQQKAAAAPRKSTIGAKKAAPKKAGLGAKKGGLGAQRVAKDFAEIEKEAELADQLALTRTETAKVREALYAAHMEPDRKYRYRTGSIPTVGNCFKNCFWSHF